VTNQQRDGEAVSDHVEHTHETSAEEAAEHVAAPAAVERTGNGAVDEVLRSLEGLEERSVAEHVAVFEAAHEALRSALADAGDRSGGAGR
jgi:hypothetical protein